MRASLESIHQMGEEKRMEALAVVERITTGEQQLDMHQLCNHLPLTDEEKEIIRRADSRVRVGHMGATASSVDDMTTRGKNDIARVGGVLINGMMRRLKGGGGAHQTKREC